MVVIAMKVSMRLKYAVTFTSIFSAMAFILLGLSTTWGSRFFEDFVFFAFISIIIPVVTLHHLDSQWRKAIDEHLPELFRNIAQAQETGMSLPKAFEEAAKGDYGPLTTELKKINTQISWSMPFEEALLAFARRVNTLLVQRTVPLMIEALRSGGRIEQIFDPMGKFIQATLMLRKERMAKTRPYIAIIYISYFVFILTIVLLFKAFFVDITGAPILEVAIMSPEELKRSLFHMAIIQGFFSGLIAGKIGEDSALLGLKHSLVMMLCGYLALKIFL